MNHVLTIVNPTSGSVAYMSRDCRITVPTGESTHDLPAATAERITAFLKQYHPLLKVTVDTASAPEPESDQEPESEPEKAAPKAPAKTKPAPSRKAKASATTDSEASAE